MKISCAIICHTFLALALAAALTGCSFFKSTEKSMQNIEKITEKVEKETGQLGKEKGKAQPQPEAKHEPVLVENKTAALRVKAALKKEGAEFDKVEVDATKTEIILTGTVGSAKARERAGEIASRERGKATVKNEIKVAK